MIDDLSPYRAYRDTDLPWLISIPENWRVLRAKNVFRPIDVRSTTGNEELLTVSSNYGVVPRRQTTVTMFKAESYVGHKLCWPGDLVVNSLWAWMQGLGVAKHHGLISSAYSVYRPRTNYASYGNYFHELLRSSAYKWELMTRSRGVWISRLQLSDAAFFDMPLLIPPANEGAAIVRYLNHIDHKINRYIHTKKKLIGLLNEQKQAIICRAVTRGLDSNAKLKSSGLPWLGEVPTSWQVLSVRRLISFITSGSRGWAKYYSDEGDLFLQSGNLSRTMSLKLDKIQKVQPPTGAEGVRTTVQLDDLLICITGALTGNVSHVNQSLPRCFVNQHVALVRPRKQKVVPRFLAYVLHSPIGQAQFKNSEYGGTKQGLGLDDVRNVQIALPPVEEQERIVRYLDNATDSMVRGICSIERDIDLLREYRTRLVSDIVTGKLDVRSAAAKLPDLAPEAEPLDESEDLLQDEAATDDFEVAEAA